MPCTVNGIGTKYYGQRYFSRDGSFITTEWVVFLYLPILPLGSFRIKPTGKNTGFIFYYSTGYFVERVPLCWRQIRNVYTVSAAIIGTLLVSLIGLSLPQEDPTHPASQLLLPSQSSQSQPYE